jgi:hypothetical protein
LVHCHAGCATEDILAALGLSWPDLFPPDPLEGPHWPRPVRDRYTELVGRVSQAKIDAYHERRRLRDADVFVDTLVQLIRTGQDFTGSLTFTCPECGAGHAWIRRNHAGLAADCDQGCDEHQVFTALARLGETEAAA